jgi:signal transduction histidine kinase
MPPFEVHNLIQQMPALLAAWDKDLRNVYANEAHRIWLGIDPVELQRTPIAKYLCDGCISASDTLLAEVLQGHARQFTVPLADTLTGPRDVMVHCVPLIENQCVVGIQTLVTDIGDLRRSSLELSEAQRIGKMGSWIWYAHSNEVFWSPQLYRLFELDETLPPPQVDAFLAKLPPEGQAAFHAFMQSAWRSGAAQTGEIAFKKVNGDTGWVIAHAQAIRSHTGEPIALRGTAQDVTERKHIESALLASRNQLRDMVAHHEIACEEERKHLAREVHDELGQLLTALRLDLAMLDGLTRTRDDALQRLSQDMHALVERMFAVTRGVVTSLRPAALDAGLVPAVEWLAADVGARTGIRFRLDAQPEGMSIRESLAGAMFRVIQESITNVVRHAKATDVHIAITCRPGERLVIRITDNGCGFDWDHVRHQTGYGLLSMRERALSLGGQTQIDTQPGRGTQVTFEIPL